jgi:peroxiredoxin
MNRAGTWGGRVAVVCLAGCASACDAGQAVTPDVRDTASAGTMAPDFTGRDVQGKTFRLSDHLGKQVVLLDFWATFCEPCKAEFGHLEDLVARDGSKGLLVVGVSMDGPESSADVPAFVKRFGLTFPVVLDDDSRIASLYDPKKSMPLSVLIDRKGRVIAVREGYNPGDEKQVDADVEAALGLSTGGAAGP